MIALLLIGNLALVREIETERLESCLKNFWGFMISVLVGTLTGMYLIGSIPAELLSGLIGGFIVFYAVLRSGFLDVHSERLRKICFRRNHVFQSMAGFAGGLVFGSTSIGALIVSYLDSIDLDRAVFVGLLSFVLFVVSGLRIVFSWFTGYYSGTELLYISILAGFPGLAGAEIGSRLVDSSDETYGRVVVSLFLILGLRLLLTV